ncbi:MAG: YceI family protein [Planctomycetota bacterium]|nr:YceI family protein [Planctomycetota bacterium]
MIVRSFLAVVAVLIGAQFALAETKYELNGKNTKLEFVGKKPDGSHTGGFEKLSGTATVSGSDLTTTKLDVKIEMTSLKSDADKLTAHLKAPDFFDVKRYPEAKFVSKKIEMAKKGYTVTGDLTMHGETKSVSFPAEIAVTPKGLQLKAAFSIDRNDWGISYGKGKINDDVAIKLNISTAK